MKKELKLLIVEDDRTDAELAEAALKTAGFIPKITLARDKAAFEKNLKDTAYDAIISGYRLPSFTGKDVLAHVQRISPLTPVIILTDALPDETAMDLMKSGAADYVRKDRLDSLPASMERALKEKELESRFFQIRKMEAVGRLASGIAHDFNNILGAIEGYATLILNGMAADDPARPDIEEIRKAEQRAAALTKQLMAFSRKHSARKKTIELNGLIAELEKMAKRLIGENLTLEVSAAPDLRPVQADAGQLEQALINLLVNARDAMPGGGVVKVTARNADLSDAERKCPEPVEPGRQFIKVSVEDSGAGMDRNTLSRLFEPFFTTKPKGKGTGLGLSTVYGIVKQHNGWLDVSSEEGAGSVFTIYLPQAPAGAADEVSPEEAGRGNLRGRGERVLVVEDDEALRKLTARMLKENGYEPAEAGTASEAVRLFSDKNTDFSIIFTDLVLRDRNGAELIDDFKKTAKETDFVFTSGYPDDKSGLEFIRSRGHTFIPKPYSIETVLKIFKKLLSPKE